MSSLAVSRLAADDLPSASIADQVGIIARKELAPLAAEIDEGTVYPDALLRRLGEAGAWSSHQPENGAADLRCAIQSIAAIGEVCGATAFMAWCQNTLVWYASNSSNPKLVAKFADKFASGQILGGTGLSNPMKSFFGIEKLKLKGRKVDGGYVVRGALPWVSNLGPDHYLRHHLRARGRGRRDCDVPRRLRQSRDHPAALQAVPRDGRHRHLWRAVPRRVRAG